MTRLIVSPAALDAAGDGGELAVDGDDHHYLTRVLRLEAGAPLELIDGAGRRAAAAIAVVSAARTDLTLTGPIESIGRPGPELVSIVALIKGERMDWAITKLVELGVDRIAPVRCERCVVKVTGARSDARRERFTRLAEAAARQCGRAALPVIDPITELADALAATRTEARLVFTPLASRPIGSALPASFDSVTLATGPEGGFTASEIGAAEAAGFARAGLGPTILRAETAAIAALVATSALGGALS